MEYNGALGSGFRSDGDSVGKFILGLIIGLLAIPVAVYFYFVTGMAPVATSAQAMPFEKTLAKKALNARVEKEMPKTVPIAADETTYLAGADVYRENCAVCHGNDLKGGGPVPYPYRVPPDLTKLTSSHGGKFPETYVSQVLRLGVVMPAHGPAEMPVWGTAFRMGERVDEAQITTRISELITYIKSFQAR